MSGREGARTGPRLGRGLAALLGDAPAPASEGAGVRSIPVERLEPGPFQPRGALQPEALAELTESVRARGILQPVLVRPHPSEPGRLQIIAGERRGRAAQAAGLHEIPALVRELADGDAMAASLVENLQRQDLNAIEEAEGYKRLIEEFGLTQEQLGVSVGKSRSHIANAVRLLQLPATVRRDVERGVLSAGHARALLSHPEPAKAALAVIARGLNVRQTEARGRQRLSTDHTNRRDAADPETIALENELTQKLGLRVQISFDGKGGAIRIAYRTLDQLDGLVTLLSRE